MEHASSPGGMALEWVALPSAAQRLWVRQAEQTLALEQSQSPSVCHEVRLLAAAAAAGIARQLALWEWWDWVWHSPQ